MLQTVSSANIKGMPWNNAREKQAVMSYFVLLLILIIMQTSEGTI